MVAVAVVIQAAAAVSMVVVGAVVLVVDVVVFLFVVVVVVAAVVGSVLVVVGVAVLVGGRVTAGVGSEGFSSCLASKERIKARTPASRCLCVTAVFIAPRWLVHSEDRCRTDVLACAGALASSPILLRDHGRLTDMHTCLPSSLWPGPRVSFS